MTVARPLRLLVFSAVSALAACADLEQGINRALGGGGTAAPEQSAAPARGLPTARANDPDALDQSTAEERAAATAARAGGRSLGQTVASLGSPAEPGFWLKTPLVSAETAGRVRDRRTGEAVAVTLQPISGPPTAGSRLSLSAMRALGVSLTDLVTLEVTG
ncbi:hypothetical protein [Roseobacter sinensis]|uniref:D-galactarate dehydratase n=1 Tax=Roseobacter sinensis TaxID=2931391 RepID=A0ABT3BFY8_9RHOB|nr:hypothetical protein [Roseobacter sp. WL0113]MCV3272501.1 hypothetical protein [Roseobacter sp. WL0113]